MVKRKLYDLEACEKKSTEGSYGITVYKEQVMLSQKLADFSKGDADVLRSDGEKSKDVLDKMKPKFISQAGQRTSRQTRKNMEDWEAFGVCL
jgi:DNA polymerase-3 subunit alpha